MKGNYLYAVLIVAALSAIAIAPLQAGTCGSATVTAKCLAIGPLGCSGTNPQNITIQGIDWQGKGCIYIGEFYFKVGKTANASADCTPSKRVSATINVPQFSGGNTLNNIQNTGTINIGTGANSAFANCKYKVTTSGPYPN